MTFQQPLCLLLSVHSVRRLISNKASLEHLLPNGLAKITVHIQFKLPKVKRNFASLSSKCRLSTVHRGRRQNKHGIVFVQISVVEEISAAGLPQNTDEASVRASHLRKNTKWPPLGTCSSAWVNGTNCLPCVCTVLQEKNFLNQKKFKKSEKQTKTNSFASHLEVVQKLGYQLCTQNDVLCFSYSSISISSACFQSQQNRCDRETVCQAGQAESKASWEKQCPMEVIHKR